MSNPAFYALAAILTILFIVACFIAIYRIRSWKYKVKNSRVWSYEAPTTYRRRIVTALFVYRRQFLSALPVYRRRIDGVLFIVEGLIRSVEPSRLFVGLGLAVLFVAMLAECIGAAQFADYLAVAVLIFFSVSVVQQAIVNIKTPL